MNKEVEELVEWVAERILQAQITEDEGGRVSSHSLARQILSHPDLALIAPFSYSDNTPIYVAFQRRGEWCGVIPLAEVLKKEES